MDRDPDELMTEARNALREAKRLVALADELLTEASEKVSVASTQDALVYLTPWLNAAAEKAQRAHATWIKFGN